MSMNDKADTRETTSCISVQAVGESMTVAR